MGRGPPRGGVHNSGFWGLNLQAPNSRIVYSRMEQHYLFRKPELRTPRRAWGAPPQQHALPFSQASTPTSHLFRKLQAPNSRIVYFPAWGAPAKQQHAWEYLFRKLQAKLPNCVFTPPREGPLPSSTRGRTFFASFRPQTPELCTPPLGGPLPAARVGVPLSQASGPKLPNCAWGAPSYMEE